MIKEKTSGRVIIEISIIWFFVFVIVLVSLIAFFKNSIYATVSQEKKEVVQTVAVEENNNAVNVVELLLENNFTNKVIIKEVREVDFEIVKKETDELPKGEEEIEQEGKNGKKQITILQTFENEKLVNELEIDDVVIEEPLEQIILVGTNEDKSRIIKLQSDLNIEMDIAKPSGLTLNDYKTMFKYNASDKNLIFLENAEVFYNMEKKYGINGVFIAAIGIHESAWGTSLIAREKHNLFGYMAYDDDPVNCAQEFESYQDGIETVANVLKNAYLTEGGEFYNGTTIESVNKRYASDEEWYMKVFAYMEYLYDKLE